MFYQYIDFNGNKQNIFDKVSPFNSVGCIYPGFLLSLLGPIIFNRRD